MLQNLTALQNPRTIKLYFLMKESKRMQTCKYCSSQFDDSLTSCPECGTKVRRKAEKAPTESVPEPVLVATAASAPEAEILCSILQAEGLAFFTECPDGFASVFGGIGGQTEVYVAAADEQKALELLEEYSSADFEISEEELAALAEASAPEEDDIS